MPAAARWVYAPSTGGVSVPEWLRPVVAARLRAHLEERFAGRYRELEVRFHGKFCYVDVYQEPELAQEWPPPGWDETREQALERLRRTPLHLCRLRHRGRDRWSFDAYSYAAERYEPCVFPTGEWVGAAEDAVDAMAGLHLS